ARTAARPAGRDVTACGFADASRRVAMRQRALGVVVTVAVAFLATDKSAAFGGRQQPVTGYSHPVPVYWVPATVPSAAPAFPVHPAPAWVFCPAPAVLAAGPIPLARPTPA